MSWKNRSKDIMATLIWDTFYSLNQSWRMTQRIHWAQVLSDTLCIFAGYFKKVKVRINSTLTQRFDARVISAHFFSLGQYDTKQQQ